MKKFPFTARFSAYLLIYTLIVVAWGAFVRMSFSGDGCGVHWPLCQGEVIPLNGSTKTFVEFFHRLSSGLIGPAILFLAYRVWREHPKGSQIRVAAGATVFFMITESAVGALLVLKSWVAGNPTFARAVTGGIHLVNTFMLLACMAWLAWLAFGRPEIRARKQGPVLAAIVIGAVCVLLMGVTGAIAALGNMIQPAKSLAQGIQQDFDPASHFLVRLRLSHPLISTSVGVYLVFLMSYLARVRPSASMKKIGLGVFSVFILQMVVGVVNLLLSRPIPLSIFHLLVADVLWLGLVFAAFEALNTGATVAAFDPEPGRTATAGTDSGAFVASEAEPVPMWKAYIALTKPRVISLLLFTSVTASFVAAKGWPGWGVLFAVMVGGYAAAGGANAINMVYDRDIDQRMARTRKRPTVTNQIPSLHALLFAFALAGLSFGVLTLMCNVLSALLAQAGLLFYVFVYTMALKRRTWHNIVIGGAAGAFPPLVGYAAVSNELTPLAWVLFAIIFLWTPVHFWALALIIKDEYRDVGIPMLPVIHGERATVIQISLYTLLTAIVSLVPLFLGRSGVAYMLTAVVLNAVLFVRTFQLFQTPEKPQARSLFKFSMVYLAVLFLMIAVDQAGRIA